MPSSQTVPIPTSILEALRRQARPSEPPPAPPASPRRAAVTIPVPAGELQATAEERALERRLRLEQGRRTYRWQPAGCDRPTVMLPPPGHKDQGK